MSTWGRTTVGQLLASRIFKGHILALIPVSKSRRTWVACFTLAVTLHGVGTIAIAASEYSPPSVAYQYNSRAPVMSAVCGNVPLLRTMESNIHLLYRANPVGASELIGDTDGRRNARVWLNRAKVVCNELLAPRRN